MTNDTKIKYLKATNKLYQVTRISLYYMIIEAIETNLSLHDVPPDEVWRIKDLEDFCMRLRNYHGEIVDFVEYKRKSPNLCIHRDYRKKW